MLRFKHKLPNHIRYFSITYYGPVCCGKKVYGNGPQESPKAIFKHQQTDNLNEANIAPLLLRLTPIEPSKLVSPNYKLVVRNADAIVVNRTLPKLDCHFEGFVEGVENSKAALSICDNHLVSEWGP